MGKRIHGVTYDVPPPKCKDEDCDNFLTEHIQLETGLCAECGPGSEKETRMMEELAKADAAERQAKLDAFRAAQRKPKEKEVELDFKVGGEDPNRTA